MRKLLWERNPDIGFWIDRDPVRFYYGTIIPPEIISKLGIVSRRFVTLLLDPYSALRRVGDGYIFLVEIPPRWLMDHMDSRLGGNGKGQQERLLNKESYSKWTRYDYEYYADVQIRIANQVPSRYITGYMTK